ncbi:hypothetical protein [Rudaeicoccus suwonensis]|nr:hypothetical protein [Rudaeicoccus suwonensis]
MSLSLEAERSLSPPDLLLINRPNAPVSRTIAMTSHTNSMIMSFPPPK